MTNLNRLLLLALLALIAYVAHRGPTVTVAAPRARQTSLDVASEAILVRRVSTPIGDLAASYARRRGLSERLVMATIAIESSGNTMARGDVGGRSRGLMQINTVAHRRELAAAGFDVAHLHDAEIGIAWGTYYLAKFRRDVLKALDGREPPLPIDTLVRLAYKAPAPILRALRNGQNPVNVVPWAADAVIAWDRVVKRISK